MRAVIQRVSQSSVKVDGHQIARIGKGLMILLGVDKNDQSKDADYLADKIPKLRIFEDSECKINRSLIDICGEILIISQFTLFGNCRKGRRPSFTQAAQPVIAERLYTHFISRINAQSITVQSGKFGADMKVALVNDGPLTLIMESR